LSSKLWELLQELDQQKRKYHEKTLSIDGEWSVFLRAMQMYDFMIDISHLLIPEFYYASMSLSLIFGLDLFELEPLNLEFEWRFPTLEEWLEGVGVVIERVLPDIATDVETFVDTNIAPEYREGIHETMREKCVYGKSAYGECYVDPAATREFLRSTQVLLLLKHASMPQRRAALEALIKALNLNRDVARSTHDRMSMVIYQHTECFTLDYSVLDISRLCEESPEAPGMGVVPFVDIEGNVRSASVYKLADSQYGCILDVSTLDYCYLLPEEDIYMHSPETYIASLDEKLRRFRGRTMITAPAVSNYVRGDEAADYHRCKRTGVWAELMALRYTLEAVVDSILSSLAPEMDPFNKRKYIVTVLQLVGHVGKRHRWGFAAYKAMTQEELEKWWLEHWTTTGLNKEILEKILAVVKPVLEQIVKRKVEMGRKLRLERLGIPLEY